MGGSGGSLAARPEPTRPFVDADHRRRILFFILKGKCSSTVSG